MRNNIKNLFADVFCDRPGNGSNTLPFDIKPKVPMGEQLLYECKSGHKTEDNLTVECTEHGAWTAPPPNCTGRLLMIWYIQLDSLNSNIANCNDCYFVSNIHK